MIGRPLMRCGSAAVCRASQPDRQGQNGQVFVMIHRTDYWQCYRPQGGFDHPRKDWTNSAPG
jgi:hypothetical protein